MRDSVLPFEYCTYQTTNSVCTTVKNYHTKNYQNKHQIESSLHLVSSLLSIYPGPNALEGSSERSRGHLNLLLPIAASDNTVLTKNRTKRHQMEGIAYCNLKVLSYVHFMEIAR